MPDDSAPRHSWFTAVETTRGSIQSTTRNPPIRPNLPRANRSAPEPRVRRVAPQAPRHGWNASAGDYAARERASLEPHTTKSPRAGPRSRSRRARPGAPARPPRAATAPQRPYRGGARLRPGARCPAPRPGSPRTRANHWCVRSTHRRVLRAPPAAARGRGPPPALRGQQRPPRDRAEAARASDREPEAPRRAAARRGRPRETASHWCAGAHPHHAPAAGLPARPGGLAAPAPTSRARWAGREGEKNLRSGCCRGPGRGAAGARGGHGAGGDSEVTPLPQTLATERTRFTLTSNVTVKQATVLG